MKEQLITFETAKLAKEKGFTNIQTITESVKREYVDYKGDGISEYYWEDKKVQRDITPTQSLLQRWLREEYKIHIWCSNNLYGRGFRYTLENLSSDEILGRMQGGSSPSEGYTYEQALELALQEALKLIEYEKI